MIDTLVEETYTAEQIDDMINGILYEFDEMVSELTNARTFSDYTDTNAVYNGLLDFRSSLKRYKVKEREEGVTLSITES